MRGLTLVHRFAGLALAIPLTLAALSGALLLLRGPWYRAQFPSIAVPPSEQEAARYPDVLAAMDGAFLPARPRVVKFPRDGFNAFHAYLTDGSEALVAPDTATVLDRWHWNERAMPFMFELHAHLLAGNVGKTLNGTAAAGVVILAVSGVITWWPRRGALPLRRLLPARVTPGDLLRSHAATGAVVMAPLLLFAATGAGIVFYSQVSSVVSRALDRQPAVEPSAIIAPLDQPRRPWREILAAADATFPGTGPAMVYAGTGGNAVITFRKRLTGEWHPNGRSYVLVNPYDAMIVQAIDARAQGAGTRAMHALYPLHAARVGGPLTIAAAAVSALGLAWLAIGGAWTYWRRAHQPAAGGRRAGAAATGHVAPSRLEPAVKERA